jgi:broad specificity phosphatase PhoE
MDRQPGLPTLYLIRHGETAWSLTGQHTGSTDIPLTPNGEAMARELAPLLQSARICTVLTRPLQRARRTCALAMPHADPVVEPDLAEWNYGAYEGLLTSEIWKTNPGWNVFRDRCPDGETLPLVVARADRLLLRLRAMPGSIALFSHGQFGAVLAARWAGFAGEAGEHFALDPASLCILGQKPGHPEVPVITRWNIVPTDRLLLAEAAAGG